MTPDVVLELPSDVNAPALARRYVAEHAVGLTSDLIDDAELLVSELVTNAIRHGQPAITLRVSLDPPGIGVAVHDHGDAVPVLPADRPDSLEPGGRGMLIVAAVASAWGVTASPETPGKTVWFQLNPRANA